MTPPAEEVHDLLGDRDRHVDLRLVRRRAEVRRADDLVELEQRMIRRRRLLAEDVERRAGDLPSRIAAASASSSTMPPRAQLMMRTPFFILRERCGADQAARLGLQRRVDGDEVGAREELVQADQLDAEPLGGFLGDERDRRR